MLADVNLWPLIGVLIIIAGFALRFNPMLVVIVTAIGTAFAAGFPLDKVLAMIGISVIGFSIRRACRMKWILLVMTFEGAIRIGMLFSLSGVIWRRL